MQKWECWDLGDLTEFLQICIVWKGHYIYIDQTDYLWKVLQCFRIENAKPILTSLPTGYYPTKTSGLVNTALQNHFQKVIGSLLYLMLGTQPDISFAVTQLAHYIANPSQDHLNRVYYICHYLVSTQNYALVYRGDSKLRVYACIDSNWTSNPDNHKLQIGYYVMITRGVFSWVSKT